MAHRARQHYPTPSPSPSPPPIVKQEELHLSDSISSPHLESTRTLALTLPGPQRQAQSKNEHCKTPCEQCRKVRRACRWVKMESSERSSCERCRKTGKQCSGPTRRSQTNLETVQPLRQSQTRRQAVASIGPSAPESRWSTKHMSYSLTYHLVETGLFYTSDGFVYEGFDHSRYLRQFRLAQGRLEQLDSVDEIFSLSHMFAGAQCSNHSALLRSSGYIQSFESLRGDAERSLTWATVGFARCEPLVSIAQKVADRLLRDDFHQSAGLDQAAQQISIWLFALKSMSDVHEFGTERLLLLKTLVCRGMVYFSSIQHTLGEDAEFRLVLCELVREEIHTSLLLGKVSSVSLSEYYALFDPLKPPTLPTIPSDLTFVFSGPPEPAEVRKAAFDFQQRWTYLAHPIYYYLEYLLAYSPSSKLLSTVECCWRILDRVTSCLENCLNRIIFDPRYDPKDARIRPGRCLNNIIHVEHGALFILKACHEALYRVGIPSAQTLDNSHRFWYKALSRTAHRLKILPECTRESFELYSTCVSLVEGLRYCPETIFTLWGTRYTEDRENMIKGLLLVSYGMPDAGRIVLHLESCRLEAECQS